jgi:DNA polymerase I-like protein with 3'-5' exonuclease and polymerase domains
MLDCWREGIVPLLQLHDELNISTGEERTGHRMAEIMATAVKLTVPALVEADFGRSWGDAKHKWEDVG